MQVFDALRRIGAVTTAIVVLIGAFAAQGFAQAGCADECFLRLRRPAAIFPGYVLMDTSGNTHGILSRSGAGSERIHWQGDTSVILAIQFRNLARQRVVLERVALTLGIAAFALHLTENGMRALPRDGPLILFGLGLGVSLTAGTLDRRADRALTAAIAAHNRAIRFR